MPVLATCRSRFLYSYSFIFRWNFINRECVDKGKNWREIKLQKLSQSREFCCRNGLCIASENRCDSSIDCVDNSDEENCEVVAFPYQYNRKSPPIPIRHKRFPFSKKDALTDVNVTFDLFSIFDIDEVKSEISMIFQIALEWRDPRLEFFNLKSDFEKNFIDKDVWIPELVFGNQKEHTLEYKEKLKVKREGIGKLNKYDDVNMKEIFEGYENSIILREIYQMKFICTFGNIDDYPFDLEYCNMNIINTNEEMVNLVPLKIQYFGSYSIAQYTVKDISFSTQSFVGIGSGIQVKIAFGRDFMSIFSVTYLPTILMNIVNQSTNFLDNSEFLEAIITVNITCMMVLSALYISVSTSLPTTSSIKFIDIWLLFSLIFPFVIILLNIMLYYIKEPNRNKIMSMKATKEANQISRKKFLVEYFIKRFLLYINPLIYVTFVIFHFFYGIYGI